MTLSGFETLLVLIFTALLMLGMGATLRYGDFASAIGRPKAILVGLASQFGWMPLIAFSLALALDLPPLVAAGLIVRRPRSCSARAVIRRPI